MPLDLLIRARRVVLPDGVRPAAIGVRRGRVVVVGPRDHQQEAAATVELADDEALLPGAFDVHVHLNEPGRADWEGLASGTSAAVAGGVTTVVDMPLNCAPVTTDAAALEAKRHAARGQLRADLGAWAGLVPDNARHPETLGELWRRGALGFKAFLIDSGLDDFPAVGAAELRAALPVIAELGAPLLAHCELAGAMADAQAAFAATAPAERRRYAAYLASRPAAGEREAVRLLLDTAAAVAPHARLHVVHVADPGVLDLIDEARAAGRPVTCETCPHYLTLAADAIADGDVAAKCAPPIRGASTRAALRRAVRDGRIDLVASDHSPCPPDMKGDGDFASAWGGIASLQLLLPLTWTALTEDRQAQDADLGLLAQLTAAAPARLAGMAWRKGAITEGADADLVAFAPSRTFTVDPASLLHRHAVSPYDGRELRGVVTATWLRGREAARDGQTVGDPRGHWLELLGEGGADSQDGLDAA